MIAEGRLLDEWRTGKENRHFYRIETQIEVGFEYRGPLTATPSTELVLESRAVLPASISEVYAEQLLVAVGRAAIDELLAADWDPYRGCSQSAAWLRSLGCSLLNPTDTRA